jgi:hypothetical protein
MYSKFFAKLFDILTTNSTQWFALDGFELAFRVVVIEYMPGRVVFEMPLPFVVTLDNTYHVIVAIVVCVHETHLFSYAIFGLQIPNVRFMASPAFIV